MKALLNAEPRWPEVPNATRWPASAGSGLPEKYAVTSRGTLTSVEASIVRPANGLTSATIYPNSQGARGARITAAHGRHCAAPWHATDRIENCVSVRRDHGGALTHGKTGAVTFRRLEAGAQMTKAVPYNSAEFLHNDVAIREYMNEALVTNDAALIGGLAISGRRHDSWTRRPSKTAKRAARK